MIKRVLVTGATGFLGQEVCARFERAKWEVISISRRGSSKVLLDFEAPVNQWHVLSQLQPCQAIVHLASPLDLSANARDEDFFSTAILATSYLLALARVWKAYFCFASSVAVYGGEESISSETPVNPKTAYGRSKFLAEEILRSSGVKHTCLRFGGIFGLGGGDHLGINRAVFEALKDRTIPTLHGEGRGLRNYIYVAEAANIIKKVVQNEIQGVHLVASRENISIREMLETISESVLGGKSLELKPGGTSKNQIIEVSSDFDPEMNFKSALKDILSRWEQQK